MQATPTYGRALVMYDGTLPPSRKKYVRALPTSFSTRDLPPRTGIFGDMPSTTGTQGKGSAPFGMLLRVVSSLQTIETYISFPKMWWVFLLLLWLFCRLHAVCMHLDSAICLYVVLCLMSVFTMVFLLLIYGTACFT